MEIRPEEPGDHTAIHKLNERAFEQPDEADLVDALREAGEHVPELCLVAVDEGQVVGHIFYSEARLGETPVLALAPMAVEPSRQREGIGSALVSESLERARQLGEYPLVAVLGHPEFYPRFGFEPAAGLGLEFPGEVPPEAWMAVRLPAHTPEARGRVRYAAAFGMG